MNDPLDLGVAVPRQVTLALTCSLNDLEGVASLLGRAEDVDWNSDLAGLYRIRLEDARLMVRDVHTRVREAAIAVRVLGLTP